MNKPIIDIIKQRFSCREYLNRPVEKDHQRFLMDYLELNRIGPLGSCARFTLLAADGYDRNALKGLGTYGFIKNAQAFIVGALGQGSKNLEDYGYLMERAVLAATDIGLGTCWLGGSFTKSSFAKKISATSTELLPAIAAVGYIAEDDNIRSQIRKRAGMQHRLPMEQLFFDQQFGNVLTEKEMGAYSHVLEMVRQAPSASNKQPWRIIRAGNAWHFYLRRTQGYGKGTMLFNLLRLADLQRVDMGIAMCHFELTAHELGLPGSWVIDEPKLALPVGTEYTVSWIAI
jgi:nitroreductase